MQYFKPLTVKTGSQIRCDPYEINSSSFAVRKNSFSVAKRCTMGHHERHSSDRTHKTTSSANLPRIDSGVSFHDVLPFEPPSCWSALEYERLSHFGSSLHDEGVTNIIDNINVSPETSYPIVHDHPGKVSRKHRDTVCLHEGKNDNCVSSRASRIEFPFDHTDSHPNSPVDSHHSNSEASEFPMQSLIKCFAVRNKQSSMSDSISNKTIINPSNKSDLVGEIVDIHLPGHDNADSVGKSSPEGFTDKSTDMHSSLNQCSDVVLPKNLKNSSKSVAASSVEGKFDKSYAESRETEIPLAAPRKKPIVRSRDLKSGTAEKYMDRCEDPKTIEDRDTKGPASSGFDSTNCKSFGSFHSPSAVEVGDAGCVSEKLPVVPTDLESSSVLLVDDSGVQNVTTETRDGDFSRYSEGRESVESSRSSLSNTFTKCHISEPHLSAAEMNYHAKAPLQNPREALKHSCSNRIHDDGKEFADSNGNASDSSLDSYRYVKNNVAGNIKKHVPSGKCTKALSDSPLQSRTLKDVSPYFITRPEKTEVFINSLGKQGDLEDLEPFAITKTDELEVVTDLSVKSTALLNAEPYFVENHKKTKDSADTRTELNALPNNISHADVVKGDFCNHLAGISSYARPDSSVVKVFSQSDISNWTTVNDADDLNGSKHKKGIENAVDRHSPLIKPRKSALLLISDNGDITDSGDITNNGVLPINDDSRHAVEQKPPQKAPRKPTRTSANDAVSTIGFNNKRESNENFDRTEKEVMASDVRSFTVKNDRVDPSDNRRNQTNSTGSARSTYDGGQNDLSYKTRKITSTSGNPLAESRKEVGRPEPEVDAEEMPVSKTTDKSGDKTLRVSAIQINRFLICDYFMLACIFPSDLKRLLANL